MVEPPRKDSDLVAFLKRVDWPRAIHSVSTLVRELRGDDTTADAERARNAARKAREGVEALGRRAVGCGFPCSAPNLCAFCQETANK